MHDLWYMFFVCFFLIWHQICDQKAKTIKVSLNSKEMGAGREIFYSVKCTLKSSTRSLWHVNFAEMRDHQQLLLGQFQPDKIFCNCQARYGFIGNKQHFDLHPNTNRKQHRAQSMGIMCLLQWASTSSWATVFRSHRNFQVVFKGSST